MPTDGRVVEVMAKQQRTTHLPADIFRLTDAFEARSGAKFNRQNLAAYLYFFFSEPKGPHFAKWMRMAVAVEKGELSVADVALAAAQKEFEYRFVVVKDLEDRGFPEQLIEHERRLLLKAQNSLAHLQQLAKKEGDLLDAIIALWDEQDWGMPGWREMFPEISQEQQD
jgi:hypothetical protein